MGGNGSGDIFLAFSTANLGAVKGDEKGLSNIQVLANDFIDPLLFASVLATEEAIINSMVAAETMTGHNGVCIQQLPHEEVREVLRQYNRLNY
jgi:L-aminopeptidase/D-esterase-like protein